MSTVPALGLREQLEQACPDRFALLRVVVEEARRVDARAYLVGGPVRDLLLGQALFGDLDIVLSDELPRIARRAAQRLSGRVLLRPRFLTATIMAGDTRLDLSRARRETYPRPGALPEVRKAALEDDLLRRDFSINAMALPLDTRAGRSLLDPSGALADLRARRIRVLHPESFRDDPTRLFRAARYAARLGFRFAPETSQLLRDAIATNALRTLSRDRIRHEIEKVLEESDAARGVLELERQGLLAAVSPGWRGGTETRAALRRLSSAQPSPPWPEAGQQEVRAASSLRALFLDTRSGARTRALSALGLRGRRADNVDQDLRQLPRLRRALERGPAPGKLDALLDGVGEPMLLLLYCATRPAGARCVKRYASSIRHRPSPIDGHAARALGLAGPAIGRLLSAARQRSLDGGPVDGAWLRRWLARQPAMR
ncbi:MAG: CCA tRNA nucleotidyltransferase [Myxococcales bacterium]|nr:CCA tRNA nucleotidyltransferase [Myxococcales bacterium]